MWHFLTFDDDAASGGSTGTNQPSPQRQARSGSRSGADPLLHSCLARTDLHRSKVDRRVPGGVQAVVDEVEEGVGGGAVGACVEGRASMGDELCAVEPDVDLAG